MRNEQEEKGKEREGLYDKLGEQRMDDVRRGKMTEKQEKKESVVSRGRNIT